MENPSLISIRQVCALTSLSRATIDQKRAKGHFPKAITLGDRRIAFIRAEVENWIRDRIADSRGEAA